MIPIELQVIGASLRAIAEEMGAALIRSAFSANIKERRDCSTALFDERGRMVTQAEHIPVHLGAMPEAVAAVMAHDPAPGEPWILNDPYAGGTHLPDLTIVTRTELGYAVTRAHHADVGGSEPGSLPPGSRTLDEEGVVIPPTRLDDATLESLVSRMRNPDERRGDLRAQLAATPAGRGAGRGALRAARARARRRRDGRAPRVLRARRPRGDPRAAGRPLRGRRHARDAGRASSTIRAAVTIAGDSIDIDFEGTAPQYDGNLNCPLAVTRSACFYVVRCLTAPDLPASGGAFVPVTVRAPEGCLVNARSPAAVAAGQHGDVEPDHRRRLRRVLTGDPGARAGPGHDEQRRPRERPLHVLRDDRRRSGRLPGRGRPVGRPRGDVEHVQHARRGARARVPAPRRALRAPPSAPAARDATGAATASSASCAILERVPALAPHAASRARTARRARRRGRPPRPNFLNGEELPAIANLDLAAGRPPPHRDPRRRRLGRAGLEPVEREALVPVDDREVELELRAQAVDDDVLGAVAARDREVAGAEEAARVARALVRAVLLRVRDVAGRRDRDVDGRERGEPEARLRVRVDDRPRRAPRRAPPSTRPGESVAISGGSGPASSRGARRRTPASGTPRRRARLRSRAQAAGGTKPDDERGDALRRPRTTRSRPAPGSRRTYSKSPG